MRQVLEPSNSTSSTVEAALGAISEGDKDEDVVALSDEGSEHGDDVDLPPDVDLLPDDDAAQPGPSELAETLGPSASADDGSDSAWRIYCLLFMLILKDL